LASRGGSERRDGQGDVTRVEVDLRRSDQGAFAWGEQSNAKKRGAETWAEMRHVGGGSVDPRKVVGAGRRGRGEVSMDGSDLWQ
jgi:hypothetical protein